MLIKEYNPDWVDQFNQIKHMLDVALDNRYVIEHVGSTSVPQIAAKDIIDIDLIYIDEKEFEHINRVLVSLGYYHNGDQGIPDREVFKRSALKSHHPILDEITHHLYVCPESSVELRRHLLFRNWLNYSAAARKKYESIKRKLADEVQQDKAAYATMKQKRAKVFIDQCIENAIKIL